MHPPTYYVWLWLDDEGQPRYLGTGSRDDELLPWTEVWNKRYEADSDLNIWLRRCPKAPTKSSDITARPMTKREAYALSSTLRQDLLKQNVLLLSCRPYNTTTGGGSKRPVVSPNDDMYVSVREASRMENIPAGQITRLCQDRKSGWRYLDEC